MNEQTPPHDLVAEQSVLGGMLISKDVIADVAQVMAVGDFYRPAHQTIFDAILSQFAKGEPADGVTITAALANSGDLQRVGGVPYLHSLIESVPTAANAPYYARIVHERAVQRRLVEVGTRIAQLGYGAVENAGKPLSDVVGMAQQAVYDMTAEHQTGDFSTFSDLLVPTVEEIASAGNRKQVGVPTGFLDLDRLLNGLHPGQLIIVAGRPGLGKSTVGAGDFVRACSIWAGLPAAVFSLEMSKIEMVMRLLSAEARIPLHQMRSGQLNDDEWATLAKRMKEIADAPIFFDDTASMTLMDIHTKARRLKQQHDLKLIVVDYLQLMGSPSRTQSRQQEVSDLSRGLKLLAKETECAVVAVSQLNRGPEQRTDKRPLMSDLRESGSIEQDADVIMLLHRDDYYDAESPRAGEADFIVAKHRNGPTDTITVAAQLHLSRFVDMAIA